MPEGGRDARVSFRTVRPADYATPYEALLKNQVAFAAVDKGQNRLLNTMARPARDRARLILRARAPTPRTYSAHTRACARTIAGNESVLVCLSPARAGMFNYRVDASFHSLWSCLLLSPGGSTRSRCRTRRRCTRCTL